MRFTDIPGFVKSTLYNDFNTQYGYYQSGGVTLMSEIVARLRMDYYREENGAFVPPGNSVPDLYYFMNTKPVYNPGPEEYYPSATNTMFRWLVNDPENFVKLVAYNLETKEWGAVLYPKEAPAKGWVGLSELTVHGDKAFVIERDNQHGGEAVTKSLYSIPLSEMVPAKLGTELPVVTKTLVRDLIPDLTSTGGYVLDKVEGLAITPDGTAWVSTDNDGVDDHSGETMFFSIGTVN